MPRKSKEKGGQPFRHNWISKYGLAVATYDVFDKNRVTSVVCRFCQSFGRDHETEKDERKRKRTMNIKTFYEPFRNDYFLSHLRTTHKTRFNEYCSLCPSEKEEYFQENENPENVNMRSFVEPKCGYRAKKLSNELL